tara:strand:+ start:294 stop:515 length:222 start_codon:yes stop_codon:yes gene_type:complete
MLDNDPTDSINAKWTSGCLTWAFFLFLALIAIWIVSSLEILVGILALLASVGVVAWAMSILFRIIRAIRRKLK